MMCVMCQVGDLTHSAEVQGVSVLKCVVFQVGDLQ